MKKYNVLVLTDHKNHGKTNSVYPIVSELAKHHMVNKVVIVTRDNPDNDAFFKEFSSVRVVGKQVIEEFKFSEDRKQYYENTKTYKVTDFDLVWLRLPPPSDKAFLNYLTTDFPNQFVINKPFGIYETGSKAFLMNFKEVCPEMKICTSIEDIIEFKNRFPIVLKPLREYGGKGIIRIDNDKVWEGNTEITFKEFQEKYKYNTSTYLGVEFLKNVEMGDKRINVVDGEIVASTIRMPKKDSWLCNVAMGGSSHDCEVDEDEKEIVKRINPLLSRLGIVIYGVDTLMGNNGKRVLSEINTTSIGGFYNAAQNRGNIVIERTIELTLNYFLRNKNNAKQRN